MKYVVSLGIAMIVGNEIFTLLVLMVMSFMFFYDIDKARWSA